MESMSTVTSIIHITSTPGHASAEIKPVIQETSTIATEPSHTDGQKTETGSSEVHDESGGRTDEGEADTPPDVELEEENYGLTKIRSVMEACEGDSSVKPSLSYIALISLAIGSTDRKRMLLSEIYSWIAEKFPYYQARDRSWRNSIRHNLSLNECFIKAGRSENGKGNYWTIHPANVNDFTTGDFRRRRARRRVRKCNEELERLQLGYSTNDTNNSDPYFTPGSNGYVMMTSTHAPAHMLVRLFGADMILSKEERLHTGFLGPLASATPSFNAVNDGTSGLACQGSSFYSATSPSTFCPQPDTSGYATTQYALQEVDNRFPALVSATDSYRSFDNNSNGQYMKGIASSTVTCRFTPY